MILFLVLLIIKLYNLSKFSINCHNAESLGAKEAATVSDDLLLGCVAANSSSLPSAEFDAQTFPLLSLLFSDKKIAFQQQQQQQPQSSSAVTAAAALNRAKASQSICKLRVDLESRKRSFFAASATSLGGTGVPSLMCLK